MKYFWSIIAIVFEVFVLQVSQAEKVHFLRYCRVEETWQKQTGKEITEENLIESLRLDWETQRKQIYDQIDAMNQDVKAGNITKQEFGDYVEAMPVPVIERNAALEIIAAAKFQSPEIDRVVMEVYAESMEDKVARLKCIKVMLNNAPEQGIQMLREYIADEERIDFDFRLIGASMMLDQRLSVPQELIDKGLVSDTFTIRRRAERLQKKINELQAGTLFVREPVKTVTPPHNPVIQEPEPTTNTPVEVCTNSLPVVEAPQSATAETSTNPWKFLLPVLGVLLVGIALFSRRRK